MLTSMVGAMRKGKEEGFCVPALAGSDEVMVRAVCEAAEEAKSPVILLQQFSDLTKAEQYVEMAAPIADSVSVPVSIILDHGPSYEACVSCIRAGFTDVMLDRSSTPYEQNVHDVSEVVKMAHVVGVGVEAELGHVGQGDKYDDKSNTVFTVPEEAVSYVKETGVDTLAVSVGTSHGVYKGEPKLNFELMEELHKVVPVPLVIHGGSGTGDENLRKLCKIGANKLNIAHELYEAVVNAVRDNDLSGFKTYAVFGVIQEAVKQAALHQMDICGSTNKA
ncbi:MAG: class II fructose-bisphosphate aldolase [Atopobiaceae bacterium]|jgi:fructose-bisphosphate aldolase class II|nr:class II fructose-bisphosphate aldolase [Atopobiaceae bacterium]MCI1388219.1 class II fructose-bisphosphate aldolase [Atopobiaceae bacterium]